MAGRIRLVTAAPPASRAYHAPAGRLTITVERNTPDWLRGRRLPALILGLLALALLLLLALGPGKGVLFGTARDEAGLSPSPPLSAASPLAAASPSPTSAAASPLGRPTPAASHSLEQPPPPPADDHDLAMVPVVGFWSAQTDISLAELRRALQGTSSSYRRVVLPEEDRQALAAALGVSLAAGVESGDPAAIRRAVRDGALGLLRVSDLDPAVRALALDGRSLFGNERLRDVADWPLHVPTDAAAARTWEQSATWTLVAGGDIQLDRWMAYHVTSLGKGVDWPWDGGTVKITGRVCCSDLGHRVPQWEPTGNEGAFRSLFNEADLAMANLEAAAVNDPSLHGLNERFRFSLSFSGDPRLLGGLSNAGFDFLSLANNHIHNAGPDGIRDTRRNLEDLDIGHAGAGRDLAQATRPAVLQAGGQRVSILPCTSVGRIARADRAGAAPCSGARLPRQITLAAEESDVVILFPHWGREYRATPTQGQRALARQWVAAGADLILGAHAHWAGAMEEIGDSLVFYSMGNLAFDQPWSEPTMQGVVLELTFHASDLLQVRLHPTLIVDDVQPNLLEHSGGGNRVINRIRDASEGLLPY